MAEFNWTDAFFREQFPRLVTIAAHYVYDMQLAEDVAQDAFIVLLDKWKSGELRSEENIGAWLKTVVINRCRSEMQKMHYHAEQPLVDQVIDAGVPDELPFIERLPKGLSAAERQALCCFYEYQMSHREIARFYNISEEACRMKMYRARMHCKKLLLEDKKNA